MPEDEDEAKDNLSRPRPRTNFRPRAQSGLEDLTSLGVSRVLSSHSASEQNPAARHIKCISLCIIMFIGCAKTVII